ncbi:hypothetical protein [Pelagibacterium lacus]|uniref:Uncharacterized protein n=1 Tax=Pelagibacterium lacus TaxID=2282655 RepID=A0A369W604_9HYPH|nr:hypothetical protein [Pelagibacterium lacus]RDE09449.1 hypothetical protein DVH29_06495 [Pelagibacterium lacus]
MRRATGLLAIGLSLLPGVAAAQPDATAQRFLDDSPSMMDFGIDRLQTHLQLAVDYDPAENAITIRRLVLVQHDDPLDFAEDCRQWAITMRGRAGVHGGAVAGGLGHSDFAHFFAHAGPGRTLDGVAEAEALAALDRRRVTWPVLRRARRGRTAPPITTRSAFDCNTTPTQALPP